MEDPKNLVDEFKDDDDPGFDLYEVAEKDFINIAKELADQYDFPKRAVDSKNKSKYKIFNLIRTIRKEPKKKIIN